MPYKNVVFIKLLWKEILYNDDRFIDQLNDAQKGLFLMLFLLEGATTNNVKNDENYLKRTLNLQENTENIRKNMLKICEVYPKLVVNNGFLKFRNFKKIHNYLRNAQGMPKECLGSAKNRIDKNRIDKVLTHYMQVIKQEQILKENALLMGDFYKRNCRAAKELLLRAKNDDLALSYISRMAKDFEEKKLSWTLETVIKYLPELLTKKPQEGSTWNKL